MIEAALLGIYMLVTCLACAVLQHPASPVVLAIPSRVVRRVIMGLVMGLTGVALIYSPLGQRSGAHMNPATTLSFTLLGKVGPFLAAAYVAAQFAGGLAGVAVARLALGRIIRHDAVRWAATRPGLPEPRGTLIAWITECAMAFGMFLMVLVTGNWSVTAGYTGLIAGAFVAAYIVLFAPISGMSINPARSFASLLPARGLRHMRIYATAPVVGMLLAAGAFAAVRGEEGVYCAKLCHPADGRPCHFNCRFAQMPGIVPRPGE